MWKWSDSIVAQVCLTLCNPMAHSLPGSAVHGIFQARVLEWGAIAFSRRTSWPRDWTQVSCTVGRCFTSEPPGKSNTVFQQHRRRLSTWMSPDCLCWNQIDYILCCQRWRSSYSQQKQAWELTCGSDHELLIAKFRLKLKKVGKTARPLGYGLNQTRYDYTVEVRNRLKRLYLIDRVPEELWLEVRDIVQAAGIKIISKKKKCKKAKWLSDKGIAEKRRERQRRRGEIFPCECGVLKNGRERLESLPQWSMQRNRGKQ